MDALEVREGHAHSLAEEYVQGIKCRDWAENLQILTGLSALRMVVLDGGTVRLGIRLASHWRRRDSSLLPRAGPARLLLCDLLPCPLVWGNPGHSSHSGTFTFDLLFPSNADQRWQPRYLPSPRCGAALQELEDLWFAADMDGSL